MSDKVFVDKTEISKSSGIKVMALHAQSHLKLEGNISSNQSVTLFHREGGKLHLKCYGSRGEQDSLSRKNMTSNNNCVSNKGALGIEARKTGSSQNAGINFSRHVGYKAED